LTLDLASEAWTCQGCGKCTSVCPVARSGLGYSPRRLIQRAIQQDLEAVVLDRALFACLACDRCTQVCKSGIPIAGVMLRLRQAAHERGAGGELAHAGILQTLMRIMARSATPQRRLGWLDGSVRTAGRGDVVYFTGCAPYFDPLFRHLGVRPLATARNALRLLNRAGVDPVVMPDERCCGHDLLWLGETEDFARLARHNVGLIRETGARAVVFTCPEGLRTFRLDYPRVLGELGFETLHITEFLARAGTDRLAPGPLPGRVAFHDPCRLGRHLGIYDAPRQLLGAIPCLDTVELPHARETATCCGGTCWVECGAAVKSLQNRRLQEARDAGAGRLVTGCPKCDIHLRCALAGPAVPAGVPEPVNIVDILAESCGIAEPSRPGAPAPGPKGGESDA